MSVPRGHGWILNDCDCVNYPYKVTMERAGLVGLSTLSAWAFCAVPDLHTKHRRCITRDRRWNRRPQSVFDAVGRWARQLPGGPMHVSGDGNMSGGLFGRARVLPGFSTVLSQFGNARRFGIPGPVCYFIGSTRMRDSLPHDDWPGGRCRRKSTARGVLTSVTIYIDGDAHPAWKRRQDALAHRQT
jgi:hypothetical protein